MTSIHRIDTATRAAPEAASLRRPHEQVEHARARELVMRAELERLAREDYRKARRYQRKYLASFDVMLSALHKANQKKRRRKPDSKLISLAGELNAWAGTDERVHMWARAKTGGYRAVNSFGIKNAALQVLAYRAANPFIHPHPSQYAAAGMGGVEVACKRILKLLRQGYVWVLEADVESNFNTMRREGVIRMIPLPATLVDAVVLAGGLNFTIDQRRYDEPDKAGGTQHPPNAHPIGLSVEDVPLGSPITACARQRGSDRSRADEALRRGRQGLPQGSACSSLFSGCLHEGIVRRLSQLAPVVHYDDNYFVFARSREELVPIAQTLRSEFQRHLAGPLLFSKCIIKDARHGFRALGFIFKVKGGRVWLRPPRQKLERRWWQFTEMIDDIGHGNATREGAVESLDGWCAAHRLWPHWRLWRKLLMGRLDRQA